MKRNFYFLMSALAIIVTSVICFSIFEKRNQIKEKQKSLDICYFKELSSAYFTLYDPKAEGKSWRLSWAYEKIAEVENHMSKDGYDWNQIKEMKSYAEVKERDQRWMMDWGYEAGINGEAPDEEYKNNSYYMYSFRLGKEKRGGNNPDNS